MSEISWDLTLITSWDAAFSKDFVDKWHNLYDRSGDSHVFFHPTLIKFWTEIYRPLLNIQPLFVYGRCDDQELIFPLILWRRGWKNVFLRVIAPAGHSDFDYHDPIFLRTPTPEEVSNFYVTLRARLDAEVLYDRLLIDGLHTPYLPNFAKVMHRELCLVMPLKEIKLINGFAMPRGKSRTQTLRRRIRSLKESGVVEFRCFVNHDGSDIQASVKRMLAMHRLRWPNAYKAPGFHENLVMVGLKSQLLDFVEMTLDGVPVAWNINFKYHGCCHYYMPAFDKTFLAYSPGNILLSHVICKAIDEGMHTVDFLRGAESYKYEWSDSECTLCDVVYDRQTAMSRFRIAAYKALQLVKSRWRKR